MRDGTDSETLRSMAGHLSDQIEKLGLLSITEAANLRGTSRASVFQLVERGRLNKESILGRTYVYRDEITNFKAGKPGPALGTRYNRKPKGSLSDAEQNKGTETASDNEMIQTPIN